MKHVYNTLIIQLDILFVIIFKSQLEQLGNMKYKYSQVLQTW